MLAPWVSCASVMTVWRVHNKISMNLSYRVLCICSADSRPGNEIFIGFVYGFIVIIQSKCVLLLSAAACNCIYWKVSLTVLCSIFSCDICFYIFCFVFLPFHFVFFSHGNFAATNRSEALPLASSHGHTSAVYLCPCFIIELLKQVTTSTHSWLLTCLSNFMLLFASIHIKVRVKIFLREIIYLK